MIKREHVHTHPLYAFQATTWIGAARQLKNSHLINDDIAKLRRRIEFLTEKTFFELTFKASNRWEFLEAYWLACDEDYEIFVMKSHYRFSPQRESRYVLIDEDGRWCWEDTTE